MRFAEIKDLCTTFSINCKCSKEITNINYNKDSLYIFKRIYIISFSIIFSKIHWDVDEYLRMPEDSRMPGDLRSMLFINENTHEFVITSQTFDNTLRQKKLNFCIYLDHYFCT